MEILKLIIDDIPPSNNLFMGNSNKYYSYNSKKKKWKEIVFKSLPSNIPKEAFNKAIVNIHYIFPDRRKRDLDNYSGKFILDSLVEFGVIKDDNYKILNRLIISAEHKPKIKKTIVKICGV